MNIHLGIPAIVAIVGAILYLATEGKPSEMGRIAFWTGLAVLVWRAAG